MDTIFRYSNKGTVYEFDTSILSEDERNKFRKLNNRDKIKYIAAYELENNTNFPKEYSIQTINDVPQNEKYNAYALGSTKLDDLKKYLGDFYKMVNSPLYLKNEKDINDAIYNTYLEKIYPLFVKIRKTNNLTGTELDNLGYWADDVDVETGENTGKISSIRPYNRNEFFEILNDKSETNSKKNYLLDESPIKDVFYIYYFNVPGLLKKSDHITMSDIDKILSVKPKAGFNDLINMFENEMESSKVYSSSTISLSEALKNILKKPDIKYWQNKLITPISSITAEEIIKIWRNDIGKLNNLLEGKIGEVIKDLKEQGREDLAKEVEEDTKETATEIKEMSDSNAIKSENRKEEAKEGETTSDSIDLITKNILEGKGSKYQQIIDNFYNWTKSDNKELVKLFGIDKMDELEQIRTQYNNDKTRQRSAFILTLKNLTLKEIKDLGENPTDEQISDLFKNLYVETHRMYDYLKKEGYKPPKLFDLIIENFPIVNELTPEEKDKLLKTLITKNNAVGELNQTGRELKEQEENRNKLIQMSPYRLSHLGEGLKGGKFLNRFKDFEPDINNLKKEIEDLRQELKVLKESHTSSEFNSQIQFPQSIPIPPEIPQFSQPSQLPQNTQIPISSQLIEGKNKLKSFDKIDVVRPENENQDDILYNLRHIMEKRRKDITPDYDEEEESEEWGAGGKKMKLLKFINKEQIKKRFKIKDSESDSESESESE